MGIRGEDGLFGALEAELRKAKEPLDCNALYNKASIREHAPNVNRVSDYLGNLWRKGLVLRVPAMKDSKSNARWLYVWKNRAPAPKPTVEDVLKSDVMKTIFSKPNIEISEEGDTVTITLPSWSITIKQR